MDIELSLDDIIQKKGLKSNRRQRKGGFQRNENNNNLRPAKNVGNIRKRPPVVVQDARNKIIQNSRRKITDAREKLAELAKQSDARDKLNKIKQRNLKTGRQGLKKRGPTFRSPPNVILRSIDPSISNPSVSISNDADNFNMRLLRRTINNRLGTAGGSTTRSHHIIDIRDDDDVEMYHPERPSALANRLPPVQMAQRLKIVTHQIPQQLRTSGNNSWDPTTINARLGQSCAIRGRSLLDDAERTRNLKSLSQEMKSRLDMPAVPASRSMGILAGSGALATQQPQGYRIVVSNLHTKVTHEDIKELFGDIGQLLTSHVVRPGTAEVIYLNLRDANKAVDAYHNRTLDGQPMKCMLVNSRHPGPVCTSVRTGAKYPSSTKSAVLPDLGAIHKALFSK